MTDKVLKRANELKEKINKLEHYLNHFAIPKASCRRIKIFKNKRVMKASNYMGSAEYELDYEEYELVNNALCEQLQRYKDEFASLKCE